MKKYKLCMLLLTTTLLFSCSNDKEKQINFGNWFVLTTSNLKVRGTNGSSVDPFGTVMTIRYFQNNEKDYSSSFKDDLENYYLNRVETLHKEFDRHYYYYENEETKEKVTSVKTINDSYGSNEEIYCSDELYDLLKLGVSYTLLTNGYYNFFAGELVSFWDTIIKEVCNDGDDALYALDPNYNEAQYSKMINYKDAMPSKDEVKNLLTFNDEHKSVIFNALEDVTNDKGEILTRSTKNALYRPSITPGGIAKGYATDILKDELVSMGYTDGWLNSGSSSISLLSNPSFEEFGYQKLYFADPRNSVISRTPAFSFKLFEESNVSTSGNYSFGKSYSIDVDGKKLYRHHIVNPFTGDCSQFHSSVTITSKTFGSGDLDALSTALVNMSTEEGLSFRETLLKEKEGYDLDIVYIDYDKEDAKKLVITTTSNFNDSFSVDASESRVVYA